MKVAKSLLLGAVAGLSTVAAAQAADLPTRKAAPVNYVRICDAYGAGFFYIPGTDTCLRVGGLVLAQMRIQGSQQMYAMAPGRPGVAFALGGAYAVGPMAAAARPGNGFGRDSVGYDATANLELDARNQTGWGTLRTFIRLTSTFGTGLNSTTGSYAGLLPANAVFGGAYTNVGATVGKEFTYLNKAFIQFAGFTMGRVQSFFDFYVDSLSYEPLRGSNQNVWALAYTATFGGGMSATLSFEDSASHRGGAASVIASGLGANQWNPFIPAGTAIGAVPAAARLPDIIANIRVDQAWGSAQLAASLHPVRAALYGNATVAGGLTPFQPLNVTSKIGYAISGGLQFKLDSLSPGDQLWLQAIYAKGAIGYVSGTNMAFTGSPNLTSTYANGLTRQPNAYGWNNVVDNDCVYTFNGSCELSSAFAITAAFKHFWTPTLSSALVGSYYQVNYPSSAVTPVTLGTGGLLATGGVTNYKEFRLGTNLVWSPVKGFDIGGEIMWIRGNTSRPFGLPNDFALMSAGLPAWKSTNDSFFGKIRMIRAF